ncbi:JAB domain-containing protein [Mariniphaga sediminis]|uniref:JAB domain-containing protein n=1 Tax=Mariniphaga sediminis TaxID=1628158 RepID=UPI003562287C
MPNHPSGSLVASDAGRKLTRKIVEIDKLLDMPIPDYIIFTSESYLSMVDEGLM